MFRRLASDGLVSLAEGRELQLTKPGRTAADGIFRRHALCEWLLTEIVGLGWAESDAEAERLQAAISPRVEAQLDELLGHPQTCPHGNPLDAESAARRPAGIPLADVEAGERATIYRITEAAEEDAALLSYLEARGLRPGAHVPILARSESLDSLTLDGPARPRHARPSTGRARARPARRGRSGAVPSGAGSLTRASRNRQSSETPVIPARLPRMAAPRVRIAPSPTGPLHIGTARTALFNYLYARRTGGTFMLRLEDTDVARSTLAFEADIIEGLHWLGITWDEGPDSAGGEDRGPFAPYRQMQRIERHTEAAASAAREGPGVPVLLHAGGARRRSQGAGSRPTRRRTTSVAARISRPRSAPRARPRAAAAPPGSASRRGWSAGTTSSGARSRSTRRTSAATS